GHAALPALTLLGRAREHFSEESELLVSECFRQSEGVSFDQMVGQPILPGFQWSGGDQSRFSGERRRLPDDKTFLFTQACALKVIGPVEAGGFRGKIVQRPRVVGLVDVIV